MCDLDPKVKVKGQKAGICDGVPSTSALVLIYIYDIVKRICVTTRLFADDTRLYIIIDLPDEAARILNIDLHTYIGQTNDLCFLMQTKPCRKLNPAQHTSLFMNDTIIDEIISKKGGK